MRVKASPSIVPRMTCRVDSLDQNARSTSGRVDTVAAISARWRSIGVSAAAGCAEAGPAWGWTAGAAAGASTPGAGGSTGSVADGAGAGAGVPAGAAGAVAGGWTGAPVATGLAGAARGGAGRASQMA